MHCNKFAHADRFLARLLMPCVAWRCHGIRGGLFKFRTPLVPETYHPTLGLIPYREGIKHVPTPAALRR